MCVLIGPQSSRAISTGNHPTAFPKNVGEGLKLRLRSGSWGCGLESVSASSRRTQGVWGRAPQPPEAKPGDFCS